MESQLKQKMIGSLLHVEGWLYVDEAWALHEMVRNLPPNVGSVTVVEIGSWKGRSTIALALGAMARGSGTIHAIDPHTGAEDRTAIGPLVTIEDFKRNITAAGVDSLVETLTMTSHAARSLFADDSIDALFLDGSHQYEDVIGDINDWQGAMKDGAAVAVNDPSYPGVYRALRERVLCNRTPYRHPMLVQNTLFFEFHRFAPWSLSDAAATIRLRAVLAIRLQAARVRPYLPNWLVPLGHDLFRRMVGSRSSRSTQT
jgi:hypothetical protein